jgi:hypothetical protein
MAMALGACTAAPAGGGDAVSSREAVRAGGTVTVGSDAGVRDIECRNGAVVVSGSHNVVTLTGACGSVTVSGDYNQLTVSTTSRLDVTGNYDGVSVRRAGSISADGSHNTVRWGSGLEGARPAISSRGEANAITSGTS